MAQWVKNPAKIHEDVGSLPGLTLWVKDPATSCVATIPLGSGIAVAMA